MMSCFQNCCLGHSKKIYNHTAQATFSFTGPHVCQFLTSYWRSSPCPVFVHTCFVSRIKNTYLTEKITFSFSSNYFKTICSIGKIAVRSISEFTSMDGTRCSTFLAASSEEGLGLQFLRLGKLLAKKFQNNVALLVLHHVLMTTWPYPKNFGAIHVIKISTKMSSDKNLIPKLYWFCTSNILNSSFDSRSSSLKRTQLKWRPIFVMELWERLRSLVTVNRRSFRQNFARLFPQYCTNEGDSYSLVLNWIRPIHIVTLKICTVLCCKPITIDR